MSAKSQNVDVVVGGGIAGLVAALLLSERAGRNIVLIEREAEVGGLLRCFDYGKHGYFDYGMHSMYETGIPALDELLFGLLPESDWQILEGSKRDLAGAYFAGGLQLHSPFPDLRRLSGAEWDKCVSGFFRQLNPHASASPEPANAYDDTVSRFGSAIADIVIDGIVQKQFGKPARELVAFATQLSALNRVVMFEEDVYSDLMNSSQLRARLAYPEQRQLPPQWTSGRKAYYPKAYGIYRVIDALKSRLASANVEIMTESQIQSVSTTHGNITELVVASTQGVRSLEHINSVVWTTGLPVIGNLLGIDSRTYAVDLPRKTVVVNLLLRQPPKMADLYYFYCYEPNCMTFRVTHFGAYCEGAQRAGGNPISVELLMDAPLPAAARMKEIAISELQKFGVITSEEDVVFSAAEPLGAGFPMPSCRNYEALSDIRRRIHEMDIQNLTLLGVMSEENVFFQRDVLAQTYLKLSAGD